MSPYDVEVDEAGEEIRTLKYDKLVRNAIHMETARSVVEAHSLLLELYYHYFGLNAIQNNSKRPISYVEYRECEHEVRKGLYEKFSSDYTELDIKELLGINFTEYMELDLETGASYELITDRANKRDAAEAARLREEERKAADGGKYNLTT